jgi:hypothetical protein
MVKADYLTKRFQKSSYQILLKMLNLVWFFNQRFIGPYLGRWKNRKSISPIFFNNFQN